MLQLHCKFRYSATAIRCRLSVCLSSVTRVYCDCSVIKVMRVLTKLLKLESHGFRYKVVLYLRYLHISLTTKLKEIPSNFKHTP